MTNSHNQGSLDQIKLAVALRMARAAVGWSQEEFAIQLGIAKTTIARMEMLEGGLSAEQLTQIVRLYRNMGIKLEFMFEDEVNITVDQPALVRARDRLTDDMHRRSDRKKPGNVKRLLDPVDLPHTAQELAKKIRDEMDARLEKK